MPKKGQLQLRESSCSDEQQRTCPNVKAHQDGANCSYNI